MHLFSVICWRPRARGPTLSNLLTWEGAHPYILPLCLPGSGLKPAPSMCSRASCEPLPHLHPDHSFGSGSFCLPSFCSILCNCVLTPRESSQELAKLESITRAYQVRPRRSLLRLDQHTSPEPPLGGSWEQKSYSEFDRQHHHPGHFLA